MAAAAAAAAAPRWAGLARVTAALRHCPPIARTDGCNGAGRQASSSAWMQPSAAGAGTRVIQPRRPPISGPRAAMAAAQQGAPVRTRHSAYGAAVAPHRALSTDTRVTAVPRSGDTTHAVALDVDGVIYRGSALIPTARDTVLSLIDARTPFVFMTNGGGTLESDRAESLRRKLDLPEGSITADHVILAHTPMRDIAARYADKLVLVVGKSRARAIAHDYGFKRTMTTAELHGLYPHLFPDFSPEGQDPDAASVSGGPSLRDRTAAALAQAGPHEAPHDPVACVLAFMDPSGWERDIQLLVDVLRSPGVPDYEHDGEGGQAVALYMSCPDLEYVNEARVPRFGAGAFGIALRHLFELVVGRPLQATVFGKPHSETYRYAERVLERQARELGHAGGVHAFYGVGDNPASDIRGANMAGEGWKSVLVRTGVYTGAAPLGPSGAEHGSGDVPHMLVEDVAEAVAAIAHAETQARQREQ